MSALEDACAGESAATAVVFLSRPSILAREARKQFFYEAVQQRLIELYEAGRIDDGCAGKAFDAAVEGLDALEYNRVLAYEFFTRYFSLTNK